VTAAADVLPPMFGLCQRVWTTTRDGYAHHACVRDRGHDGACKCVCTAEKGSDR
jgi:hypothetical protein